MPAQGPLMFCLLCVCVCLCHISQPAFISLYLCQFSSDLYQTLNLSTIPTFLIQVCYPQMATIRQGELQIIKKNPSISIYQFNSDLYETLNLIY